ncbi:hypothetical protein GW17_00044124 [Ensete ventricosum]|nr:hypothetical protein GW17_00044124 [Ensete ventricosum]
MAPGRETLTPERPRPTDDGTDQQAHKDGERITSLGSESRVRVPGECKKRKMNTILRKCKSLSKLGRTSSYSSLRSKSTREEDELWPEDGAAISTDNGADEVAVFVGSSRRRYLVNSKHLNHPLLSALIDRSMHGEIRIKCEVVLFDHLLWMLENAELDAADDAATLEELAELYAC